MAAVAKVPKAAALQPLQGAEVALVGSCVAACYGSIMGGLHFWAAGSEEAPAAEGFWGTLPSVWDHPEPNYVVSHGIGEFWSVLTTIPVAGFLLLYEGVKYSYNAKVMRIYLITCIMYSLAFAAHLTLQRFVFSTTVCMVMSNAYLTFAQFSYVVHRMLHSKLTRGAICLASEALVIAVVATLPYKLQAQGLPGGVWTLFVVQAPGVFLATSLAWGLLCFASTAADKATFRLVARAGALLSTAMWLSLVECMVGFEYGFLSHFWGFPWLHIAIHVLEQVGIYTFGVGVAALESIVIPPYREGAELRRTLGGIFVYLYCPHPIAGSGQGSVAPASEADAKGAEDRATCKGGASAASESVVAASQATTCDKGTMQAASAGLRCRVGTPTRSRTTPS